MGLDRLAEVSYPSTQPFTLTGRLRAAAGGGGVVESGRGGDWKGLGAREKGGERLSPRSHLPEPGEKEKVR